MTTERYMSGCVVRVTGESVPVLREPRFPTMSIKHGVSLEILTPQAVLAACITASILAKYGYGFTLTSGRDGVHMPGSLHTKGRAFDFRSRDMLEGDKTVVLTELRESLGPEFDVVVESDHVHVEWDPAYLKGPRA